MSSAIDTSNITDFLLEEDYTSKEPLVKMEDLDKNIIDQLEDELDRVYHDSITRLLRITNLTKENHQLKAHIVELERRFYRMANH